MLAISIVAYAFGCIGVAAAITYFLIELPTRRGAKRRLQEAQERKAARRY